jgi:hypothetical protein
MWKPIAVTTVLIAASVSLRADNPSPAIPMDPEQIWELKHSDEVRAELERREQFFEAEMATRALPDWAGHYYSGDGLGKNIVIRIAPQGGFIFTWHGCLGLYDVNYGAVARRGDRLVMTFELPNDPHNFGVPRELVPVRWGERNYLLTDEDLKPFVNAVNSGQEPQNHCVPRCGYFLLRNGDDARPVSGQPELPAEYRRLLLDRPITGRVLRVLDEETEFDAAQSYGRRTIRVEIDLGSEDGVWKGMELYEGATPYIGSGFEVVETQGRRSVAIKREVVGPEAPALEPGTCVSTRPGEQTCPIEQTAALR